jgi:hypothetical protein
MLQKPPLILKIILIAGHKFSREKIETNEREGKPEQKFDATF